MARASSVLPGTGRASEQEVMRAGRRHLQGATGVLLAFDVGEVDDRLGIARVLDGDAAGQRLQLQFALEVGDQLRQGPDGDDVDPVDEGRFGGVDGRDERRP